MDAGSRRIWNVRELRIELTTLLGLDQHPAELPGLGYIPATVARPLAESMASAEWRFVICAPNGTPICSGITRHRPDARPRTPRDLQRGGILELQVTSTQLFELSTAIAAGQHPQWAPVITNIVDRYRSGVLDTPATGLGDATDHTAAPSPSDADVRRRHARAGLRRWVEVRSRYCQHPACRMPATQCDQDHRADYAFGGLTVDENLDPGCRHDHRLQHDGGWIVYRPPGSDPLTGPIMWLSPLGHTYESRPPPVMQPYPEPGSHYPDHPDHSGLPAWFTALMDEIKDGRRARAGQERRSAEPGQQTRTARPTESRHPANPPF